MTASANPNLFEQILAEAKAKFGNVAPSARVYNDAIRAGLQGTAPTMTPLGGMQGLAQKAGNFALGAAKWGAVPLAGLSGLGTIIGAEDGSDVVEGIGQSGGGMLATAAALKAMPALAKAVPVVGPTLAVAAPIVAGMIGSNLGGKGARAGAEFAGGMANRTMAATQQGATNTIVNATDPLALSNVTGKSADDLLANYERLSEMVGKDRAAAMLAQEKVFERVGDLEQLKARIGAQMAPVNAAREQAMAALQGGIGMYNRVFEGANTALATQIANNPYANPALLG